jgi:hypothetical protein
MKTKHTPAPWTAHANREIIGADTTVVGWVNRPTGGNSPQENANARLIATAPELLAACQHLGTTGHCFGSVASDGCEQCAAALAAIAKAEGR